MLRIHQTYAQIGIQTKDARLQMNSTMAKVNIHQEFGMVEQKSELPKVQIDQYQCFAESGLKNSMDLMLELKQYSRQKASEYIDKVVADGNTLASIENGSNPIPDFAERDAYPEHEFGMVTMPKSRPRIEVTGDLKFNVRPSKVECKFVPNKLEVQFTPQEIHFNLRQQPSVQIEYIGNNVDVQI